MKKLLLLILGITVIFLGFQAQNNEKYYYAFNEKIPLAEVEQKFVVRYSEIPDKNLETNSFLRSDPAIKQKWHDDKTVVLSSTSKVMRNALLQELKKSANVASCQPMYKIKSGLEMLLTDEVLIRFKATTQSVKQTELLQKFGSTILKTTDTYQLLKVPKGADALVIANQYQESGLVEFSHPNFILEIEKHQQVIPNDPYFANQFTLNNTGQIFNDGHFGAIDADIDAPEAWALTAGANVLVAVLDEGVSPNHPDLPNARQVRLNGSNFADGNPNDPSPTGNLNHGNSCAGVIAATQNNNEGIAGICPNCRIMPIRIFNANQSGIASNRLADAIDFARTNGADIISNSWGFNSDNPNFQPVIVTAIQAATTQGRVLNGVARGCVVLFSASNSARHTQGDNGQVSFPSNVNISGVLTVGASDRNDLQSDYSPTSNPASSNNQIIDIVAPSHRAYPPTAYQNGVVGGIVGETFEAWSIDVPNNAGYNPWPQFTSPGRLSVVPPAVGEQLPNAGINFQSYTGRFGGTSHSCPVVAGIAALILSANPNLTQQQVFNIVTSTANQVGGYAYTNGRSNELGFGRANACQAVREAFRLAMTFTNNTNGLVCSTTTFSLQNAPANAGLIGNWSSGTGLSINNSGVATRINNYDGLSSISRSFNTGCGISLISALIWVGRPVSSISGTSYAYPGQLYTYSTIDPNLSGAFNFNWNVVGGTIYGGGGPSDTSVTIFWNESGYITLTSENLCGTSQGTLEVTVDLGGGGGGCDPCQRLQIYPNPTSNELNITLNSKTNTTKESESVISQITIRDNSQNLVYSTTTKNSNIKIYTGDLQNGLYFLKVSNKIGTETKHILIEH